MLQSHGFDIHIRRVFLLTICLFYTAFALPRPQFKGLHLLSKRSYGVQEPVTELGCFHMSSDPGEFWYSAPDGSNQVCGLYMIAPPDHVVEIHFKQFDVSCEKGGLVEYVDGWSLGGELFPGQSDHELPVDDRFRDYCGKKRPVKPIRASQNVALLQYRILRKGQGFKVKVVHKKNPAPCNIVAADSEGVLTLTNHGRAINCTASIIYPEMVTMETINIGGAWHMSGASLDTGIMYKCEKRGLRDFAELRVGDGMDPAYMTRIMDVCGVQTNPNARPVPMTCGHSAVRLVSSGRHHNSLTFRFRELLPEELALLPQATC